LGLPCPDKTYQKPPNWTLSLLSADHYSYALADVELPVAALERVYETTPFDADAVLRRLPTWYVRDHQWAVLALARCHARGLPLDVVRLSKLAERLEVESGEELDRLMALRPEFRAVEGDLQGGGLTAKLRAAWVAFGEECGIKFERNASGVVSLDSRTVELNGLAATVEWEAWERCQQKRKLRRMLLTLKGLAGEVHGGSDTRRLHPLLALGTDTMRSNSQEPNVQNLPNKQGFRTIIHAPAGYKILSMDYSQIELRIAAALCQRARQEIEAKYISGKLRPWMKEAYEAAHDEQRLLEPPVEPQGEPTAAFWTARASYQFASALRAVKQRGTPLVTVFQRNLDPHLLTAIGMAGRAGKLDLAGRTPTEFLVAATADEVKILKSSTLKHERQAAKALNFGLLYGMGASSLHSTGVTSYGLTWTTEEAAIARDAWFEIYPEVALWHLWVKHDKKHDSKVPLMMRNRNSGELDSSERQIWCVQTLSNRTMYTTELRNALNYQDQGTGADMAMAAIARLPEPAASCLINLIHDELLFEVPDALLETVQAQVRQAMLAASDELLAPYGIPSDCDGSVGDFWDH
jgi:DNA polymerase-1